MSQQYQTEPRLNSEGEQIEITLCRVKLTRNARGETQIEVSVREGCGEDELRRISEIAQGEYDALLTKYA